MALGENQNKIQYTVTTSDDSFEFPYKYWESDEIVVTKLASGVETNPAFTITPTNGDPENGGTVILDTAVTSCTITIERIVAQDSEADYKRGALSPTSLTEGFDRAAAGRQQLAEQLTRIVQAPVSDPAGLSYELSPASERAGKVVGFDTSGNVTSIGLVASGTVGVDDSTIEIDSNIISIKDSGVDTTQIADSAVTLAKINDAALSGFDATLVTGTAGNNGRLVSWDANGDVVDSGYDVIDDDSFATADDASVPTSESVKAYVDTEVGDFAEITEFESTEQAIPAANTDVEVAHGLGSTPRWFTVVYRCKTAEFGWAVGDEIAVENGINEAHYINTWTNATNVGFRNMSANNYIVDRAATGIDALTPASWRLVFRAWK